MIDLNVNKFKEIMLKIGAQATAVQAGNLVLPDITYGNNGDRVAGIKVLVDGVSPLTVVTGELLHCHRAAPSPSIILSIPTKHTSLPLFSSHLSTTSQISRSSVQGLSRTLPCLSYNCFSLAAVSPLDLLVWHFPSTLSSFAPVLADVHFRD